MPLLQRIWASPWPSRAVRAGLGALFVWAGAAKLLEPRAFAALVSRYELVPESLLVPVALGLPALEAAAGVGLLFDRRWALVATTALLLLFLGVLWFGVLHNLEIDCGCFSAAEQAEHGNLRQAFGRDLVLLAGVTFLWLRRRPPQPPLDNSTLKEEIIR